MKRAILCAILFLASASLRAQTTSVSGTVTDTGGVAWKTGTYTFTFLPSPTNPTANYFQNGVPFNKNQVISGSLDNTGSFTSIAIPDNLTILPNGSQWAFQVCPAATASNGCYNQNFTITGPTLNITSSVAPPPVVVSVITPGFYAAYTDGEIFGARQGATYFNLTDATLHICGLPVCTWLSLASPTSILGLNNTFTGNNTFSGMLELTGASCTAAGMQTAANTVAIAGTVDARACTTAFTWNSTVTITQAETVYMPCANVSFTAQLLAINASDVHVHFCGSGATGQLANFTAQQAGSTYTASGLSGTTDAVVVTRTGGRATQDTARISGVTIDNALINMNSVGRRAFYFSTCWSCRLDHSVVYGQNCSDGGVYQEADPAADGTLFAASYFMRMDNVVSIINQTNTTCHPFYFDASNGEIAYGVYTNLFAEGFPQAVGSGNDSVYVNTGAASVNQSFDQNVFINLKMQDPSNNDYGIKLQCRGNFASVSNGRCFNVQFVDAQPEHIFSTGGNGVGIGCVNASGVADGTGCGFIVNQNLSAGGWANNEDVANLGGGYMSVSDNAAQLQGPIFRISGLFQGIGASATSTFERVDPTCNLTANNQQCSVFAYVPSTTNAGNFTGGIAYLGPNVDMASGNHTGGAFAEARGEFCNGFGSWATTMWCAKYVGPNGNIHLDAFEEIGTAGAGNPGGVANGSRTWFDQANEQLSLNNNNLGFLRVTQTVGSGTTTTNGTGIATLTSQAQPAITVTGALATDTATCALNAAVPATWQTGIVMLPPVITANTVTVWLSNPTATATITPAATAVRCTVTR